MVPCAVAAIHRSCKVNFIPFRHNCTFIWNIQLKHEEENRGLLGQEAALGLPGQRAYPSF